ncbi:ERMIN protein, partial [Oreotrochilus melanogaster]|nr:ERMIN protein [Oreotrochilus melanogaster]
MTEEVPAGSTMPECNGSIPPEKGPHQVVGVIDEITKSVETVPYVNAETSPEPPPGKENQEENRNSLAEDVTRGDFVAEKQSEEKPEGSDGTLQPGPAAAQDMGTDGQESEGGPGRAVGSGQPEPGAAGTPTSDSTGDAQEEAEDDDDDEEEEEDTEEDEVQVIEMKKENSEASHLKQQDSSKEASSPTSPGCDTQPEKPGELPSLGKKNDISRHSYSRYNTISYRRIRKGNTKQRIDEFESMMHL